MINIWEHFDGKIVFFAKTDTNLLTHKAEDGLAEAEESEDEADEDEEEEEEDEEEEEEEDTLGDEELKKTQIMQMPQSIQKKKKCLSQKHRCPVFQGNISLYPELLADGEEDEEELAKRPRGGAFAEE